MDAKWGCGGSKPSLYGANGRKMGLWRFETVAIWCCHARIRDLSTTVATWGCGGSKPPLNTPEPLQIARFLVGKEIVNSYCNLWSGYHRETIFIEWRRPQEGWVKLICDGSQNDRLDLTGCGGLLRDSDGTWIKGYSQKLRVCDALHAKM
ncbi:receptor-like kinase [Trifolium medium]|uniref:Receptor-like kinase n=1 Tax=Trifolium medium TaxID=97028 RepID=A0A392M083_9FABA|nr:receptor-like kinase [Trifolium medium]